MNLTLTQQDLEILNPSTLKLLLQELKLIPVDTPSVSLYDLHSTLVEEFVANLAEKTTWVLKGIAESYDGRISLSTLNTLTDGSCMGLLAGITKRTRSRPFANDKISTLLYWDSEVGEYAVSKITHHSLRAFFC